MDENNKVRGRAFSSMWLMAALTAMFAAGERPPGPTPTAPPPRLSVKNFSRGERSTAREDARRVRQRARLPQHEIERIARLDAVHAERAAAWLEKLAA